MCHPVNLPAGEYGGARLAAGEPREVEPDELGAGERRLLWSGG